MWSSSKYWNLEQYENVDWKLKINFRYARAGEDLKIKNMKYNDHESYMQYFEQYIHDFKIVETIEKTTKDNLYLHNRLEIIKSAMQFFKKKKYVLFVYLMVPQVEGLFNIYKNNLDINDDGNYSGLSEKLRVIYENEGIWGYVYYAFDFPKLRNDIAHGNMIDIDEECAFDLLMDISYLIHRIDSEEMNYKIVIDFFKRFDETADKVEFILDYFSSDSLDAKKNLKWLIEYLKGSYVELIQWYKCDKAERSFIKILKSKQFRINIYNREPLKTYESKIIDEKEFKIIKINTEVLKFIPMLNILKQKYTFPENWISEIDKRIKEIEEVEKEQEEILERFINSNY